MGASPVAQLFSIILLICASIGKPFNVSESIGVKTSNKDERVEAIDSATLRRLAGFSWMQELAEVNEVEEELNALSAANDALRDQILADYYYDAYEQDSDYYDDDDNAENYNALLNWFESLSSEERDFYYEEAVPDPVPVPPPAAVACPDTLPKGPREQRPERPTGYVTNRNPSFCDRVIVSPKDRKFKNVKYYAVSDYQIDLSDHDMVIAHIPDLNGMNVLIMTWNWGDFYGKGYGHVDEKKDDAVKFIYRQKRWKNILETVEAKIGAAEFKKVELYFFAFQEAGKYGRRKASGFQPIFDAMKEMRANTQWSEHPISAWDIQGTASLFMFNPDKIVFSNKGGKLPVVRRFSFLKKSFILGYAFQKSVDKKPFDETKASVVFANAHLPVSMKNLHGYEPVKGWKGWLGKKQKLDFHGHVGYQKRVDTLKRIEEIFSGVMGEPLKPTDTLILAGDLNFRNQKETKQGTTTEFEQLDKYMATDESKFSEIAIRDFHETCKREAGYLRSLANPPILDVC